MKKRFATAVVIATAFGITACETRDDTDAPPPPTETPPAEAPGIPAHQEPVIEGTDTLRMDPDTVIQDTPAPR